MRKFSDSPTGWWRTGAQHRVSGTSGGRDGHQDRSSFDTEGEEVSDGKRDGQNEREAARLAINGGKFDGHMTQVRTKFKSRADNMLMEVSILFCPVKRGENTSFILYMIY